MQRRNREESSFERLIGAMAICAAATSRGIAIAIKGRLANEGQDETAEKLRKHFVAVYPEGDVHSAGIDPHVGVGLHRRAGRNHTGRMVGYPRLVDLVLFHVGDAFEQASGRGLAKEHLLVPSPLLVAIEALTVPEESHSRAYPLVAARLLLSHYFNTWPRNSFVDNRSTTRLETLDESALVEEISNCRTFVNHGDLWAFKAAPRKSFVGHYMAARGVLLMRIAREQADGFLLSGMFTELASASSARASSASEWQFRLEQKFVELPPPSEFMNEMLGIPLALRGTENVFFNGLKPSTDSGLVMQVSGGPGTGKTTYALALAAALAPIGTQTLYFSFEESISDLTSKLRQQSQPRLNKLSYRSGSDETWFRAMALRTESLEEIEASVLRPLREQLSAAKNKWSGFSDGGAIIPPLPFMVVVDSLSALLSDGGEVSRSSISETTPSQERSRRRRFADFVELCREVRALVVLITGEDRASWGDLDYLVDMVIALRVEGSDQHSQKPIRLFTLTKSRQQITRHGTHIFHLSGDVGFRLAPQLSSQMDAQQYIRPHIWDRDRFSETFNVRKSQVGNYKYVDFLKVHARSQILIQGRGSAGKAGLAMRCALAPQFRAAGYEAGQGPPRILVMSFLYPPIYYENLHHRSVNAFRSESAALRLRGLDAKSADRYIRAIPRVSVINLTPGALYAEDLYSKLVRKLEEGRLNGRPYTAVIIDGLHNLALQFPGAGESSYLFPIIYGTLSRANVTTISTFTTMSLESSEGAGTTDIVEESDFRLRGHLPLLHTLVQASDYVFEVLRSDRISRRNLAEWATNNAQGATYLVRVQSASSRDPPSTLIGWQRQRLEFTDPGWGLEGPQRPLPIE